MLIRTFSHRAQRPAQHPGLDTSPTEIIALIKRISWEIDHALEPLCQEAMLTQSELRLLLPLRHRSGPVIARTLAEWMKQSPAAISKSLARLEKRGLILREPSCTNHRAVHIFLTDKGREVIDTIYPRQLEIEAEILMGIKGSLVRAVEGLNCPGS